MYNRKKSENQKLQEFLKIFEKFLKHVYEEVHFY